MTCDARKPKSHKLNDVKCWLEDRSRVYVEPEHIEIYLEYITNLLAIAKAAKALKENTDMLGHSPFEFRYELAKAVAELEKD